MRFTKTPAGLRWILAVLFFAPQLGRAALTWETQRVDLTVKSAEKVAVGVFRFANNGTTPITIVSAIADCGCTTAELTKKTYAPGEKGELKAIFAFETRVGMQQKSIEVQTDEAGAPRAHLMLITNILEPMTYAPRVLLWTVGGDIAEKTVTISPTGPNAITGIEIREITDQEAAARVEAVPSEKSFRLIVHPLSSTKTIQAKIDCIANFADGTHQPFAIFALMR